MSYQYKRAAARFAPVIAGFLLAAATAPAVAGPDIDVYASIRVGLEKADTDDGVDANDTFKGRDFLSRFGLKGSHEINEGLKVIGGIEYGLDPTETSNDPLLRLGYIGLGTAVGDFTFGSQTLVWHSLVRGAYFSDGADSLRLGTIRDSDLLNYWYNKGHKNGPVAVGVATQINSQDDDEDLDQYQVGADIKAAGFRLQLAALGENQSVSSNGVLLGARAWWTGGPVTLSGYIHKADEDFDLYAGNLCGGTDDTTITGIYARYKSGANTIHGRYAKRTCDTAAEPSSIKLEYVRSLSDNARIWMSHEVFDGDTGTDVNETQIGFRYDF